MKLSPEGYVHDSLRGSFLQVSLKFNRLTRYFTLDSGSNWDMYKYKPHIGIETISFLNEYHWSEQPQVGLLNTLIAPHFVLYQNTYSNYQFIYISPILSTSFDEASLICLFILDYLETPNGVLQLEISNATFYKIIYSLNKKRKKECEPLWYKFILIFLSNHSHTNQDFQIPPLNYYIYSFIMEQVFIDTYLVQSIVLDTKSKTENNAQHIIPQSLK